MPRLHLLLLAVLAVAAAAAEAAAEKKPTAYEVLESYDFPVGILPKGVTSYTLEATTGDFTATLDTGNDDDSSSSTCEFAIEGSYWLRNQRAINRPHRHGAPHRPPRRRRQGPLLLAQHRRGHPPRGPPRVLRRHRLRRLHRRQLPRVPAVRLRLRLRRRRHLLLLVPPAAARAQPAATASVGCISSGQEFVS
ncbi:hypothetical protein OsJ_18240 [Oryza sativa Japonica Group]|uniref:Uncharacterized protein n=1 Tax=Oryza sativa subsp. japonica TaxID=39947 RepID=B9FHG3_ORYSJ|nr:hypothetical protein OsJ_18240 [Oryza sativa Japonica Group]